MVNKENIQLNKYALSQSGFKETENKLLGLSRNVLALRFILGSKHNKTQNYFNVLMNQIYAMKKQIDYIKVYLNIKTAANKSRSKGI
ncbi:hypothetical protein [Candidatus Tisiphia endosymbiont of Beris chalybata]|uniref:hypothetical protein n=1 Tax=Candidatus Tisiphia endosymbiont of Beris chalybata TaxID=3066262 RepID=UPI00312C73B7